MATNTLINYLEQERYSAFPGGSNEAVGTDAMNRRQVETFVAGEALAIGDCVALDFAQTNDGDKALFVRKADSADTEVAFAIGFCVSAAAAEGDRVDVCVRGICEANVNASTAQGSRLIAGTTAGRADLAPDINEGGAATIPQRPILAVACEADTANVATVFVIKQF